VDSSSGFREIRPQPAVTLSEPLNRDYHPFATLPSNYS
jgi:hypothetical protein